MIFAPGDIIRFKGGPKIKFLRLEPYKAVEGIYESDEPWVYYEIDGVERRTRLGVVEVHGS